MVDVLSLHCLLALGAAPLEARVIVFAHSEYV